MSSRRNPVSGGLRFPLRICHVISGDLWAGAEVMVFQLLKGLHQFNNLELSAILFNEGKLADEIRKLGIPVTVVDEGRLNFFQLVRKARKIIQRKSPDILHSHRQKENLLAYISSIINRKEIQLISTQHGMPEPLKLKYQIIKDTVITKYVFHVLSTHFRYVIAVSEDLFRTLSEKYKLPSQKLVVIRNGTEVRDRVHHQQRNSTFTIGSAGRLFPVKDYPFFVEVAAEVNTHAGDVRFELAGEGPEYGRLLEQICAVGLQDVFSLKGFVENMESFYDGLDLYISTSLHEGFPMSVLEAMSHGLPVVAPLEGGIKEAVDDGVEGFLIEGRDPKQFAQKCLLIYRDRVLRNHMGAASRERVSREFSANTMAEKYYELYCKVLSEPDGAGLS